MEDLEVANEKIEELEMDNRDMAIQLDKIHTL